MLSRRRYERCSSECNKSLAGDFPYNTVRKVKRGCLNLSRPATLICFSWELCSLTEVVLAIAVDRLGQEQW